MKLLFEGIRVTKSVLDKVLKESDDIQMGFECEFNMPFDSSDTDFEINVFGTDSYEDVKKYFVIKGPDVHPRVILDYIDDNVAQLAEDAGFDESEVEQNFMKEKFDEKHWYRNYLEEHEMWDYDGNKPKTGGNIPNEEEVKNIIINDIRSDSVIIDGEYYTDHMEYERKSFISEHYTNEEIAQEMYLYDPAFFFSENDWELAPGYQWTDESMGIIELTGAQFMPVIDAFEQRFPERLIPMDYHVTNKENDVWYIEPDASLVEYGAEVSSAVYPLMEALTNLEEFFEFMQEEELETDESTGLHVSLSFINNDKVNTDWVKLALLIGEEHTLKQFDRIGNTYTNSQIDKIENYISNADITNIKHWSGFKELSKMAVDSLREKNRTFNIQDFYNNGRVEFRIIGNAGYEDRFKEIRYHILRFVMMMKIASDENLFKREYMKKFGTLMIRAKQDALDPSDVVVTRDIADNKYFKMAKQVFRGRKDIAKSVASFIQSMNNDDKEQAIKYIVSLASVVTSDNHNEYKKLFESTKSEKLAAAKKSLLRNMAADYGITKEDFEEYFNKNIDTALDLYVPIADELLSGNVLGTLAYQLITPTPEQEEKITRKGNWFVKRIPLLRKIDDQLREALLKAIAPTLSPFDSEHGSDLTDTFQQLVSLAYKKYPRNENISNLLLEILELRNIGFDDLNLNELNSNELRYLGIEPSAIEDNESLNQTEVLEKYMDKYKSVLWKGADVDPKVLQTMLAHLLFGNKSTGENILLRILYSFRELFKDATGEYSEPDDEAPGFRALMDLAIKFRPGTNVKNNMFTAMLPALQDWYGINWL